ncbi:MAG: hypothetical protein AAF587_25155 [Bacteroidota bacterium]
MNINTPELRIAEIITELGRGQYIAEDVFTQERIGVTFSGKQRLTLSLPMHAVVYIAISNSDKENARYIHTWRNPMREDNTKTPLEKQKQGIDARYIEHFGMDKFNSILVYGE